MTGTRQSDKPKVVFELDVAREVVDLIDDSPGTADEDLLDDALVAMGDAGSDVAPAEQQGAARGELVAIEMPTAAAGAIRQLIVDAERTRPRLLRRVADRLKAKLRRAEKKRRR